MKLIIEFELDIEGKIAQKEIRDKFLEWFQPPGKVSPEEHDDEFQVWIKSMSVR